MTLECGPSPRASSAALQSQQVSGGRVSAESCHGAKQGQPLWARLWLTHEDSLARGSFMLLGQARLPETATYLVWCPQGPIPCSRARTVGIAGACSVVILLMSLYSRSASERRDITWVSDCLGLNSGCAILPVRSLGLLYKPSKPVSSSAQWGNNSTHLAKVLMRSQDIVVETLSQDLAHSQPTASVGADYCYASIPTANWWGFIPFSAN